MSKPLPPREGVEQAVFDFLCRRYVQRSDSRQQAMGLQYTTAGTHDLAKQIASLFERLYAWKPPLPWRATMPADKSALVGRYGSMQGAIAAAERLAALFLQQGQESGPDWATCYIQAARAERHMGDCAKARWWEQGPVTCAACVYEEMMERAWREMGIEHD